MKRVLSIALVACLLFFNVVPASAATKTTYGSTTNSSGTGKITIVSSTSRSATGSISVSSSNGFSVNGVNVRVDFTIGVGNTREVVKVSGGVPSNSYSITATAPYTYVTAISALGTYYYAGYKTSTGTESVTWTGLVSP